MAESESTGEWAAPDSAPNFGPPLQPQGYPDQGFGPAGKPVKKRKRALWIVTAVVAVLALAAAGVYALLPGRTGNSVVAKVVCKPTNLTTCLIKAPAGAIELSSTATPTPSTSPWPQQSAPSADVYASVIGHDTPGVGTYTADLLDADNLLKIVHTDWNAVDGNNVDLVVLSFSSQKGAQAWNSTRTAEIMAAYRGQTVAIPADSTAKAYASTKVDAQGNFDAAYSTVVGTLVLNVTYSSPKQLSAPDLENWAGTELASIRTAPAAPADPADTAPGTQQINCAGQLAACLMPIPHGDEHWVSPNSSLWVSSSTVTPSQFIQLSWVKASQQNVTTNFNAVDVTGIAHQDWMTDDAGKQADLYLIQTLTAAGAARLAGENFGEPVWNIPGATGISFTIPNEPDAQAWYTNKKDSFGLTEAYFMEVAGNVIVHGWMFFNGPFDSGTATSWAQSELNLVNQNSSTQPMGLYPLTAPTLPAASQGTCPVSGDCLLPLPAGATDTTASSYSSTADLDASTYATEYDGYSGTDVGVWLDSDGFKDAEHHSWTTASGASDDAVLLKYGTPTEAKAAALYEYGDTSPSDRVCTDPAVPDSMCLATPVSINDFFQKETIWVVAWKGDYEVSVSVTVSNQADLADAYALAQQQLDLLPPS